MSHLSVVVPVYKAEDCLCELYRRLCAAIEPLTRDFEILFIEDCGEDSSWEIILDLSKKDPRVKGIKFSRNFGQHHGITAGLDHCSGEWTVVMDCDLQDRPEEIPNLYRKAMEGYDVVLARRVHRKDKPSKVLGSKFFYWVFSYLTETQYSREVGNFRIISKKVVRSLRSMREQLRFFGGLVHWLGFPTASVEVQHDPRFKGETTYTFKKLYKLAFEAIIEHSDKPLRLCVKFGFTMAAVSFCFGVFLLAKALYFRSPVLGWSSLIISMYFLGGVIITILGVMGVYLGKTFDEVKRRPLYIISDSTSEIK